MYILNAEYYIKREPSVFQHRTGLEDVRIWKQSPWGARHNNQLRYRSIAAIAAEDGSILNVIEPVPEELTREWLADNGFIDNGGFSDEV